MLFLILSRLLFWIYAVTQFASIRALYQVEAFSYVSVASGSLRGPPYTYGSHGADTVP